MDYSILFTIGMGLMLAGFLLCCFCLLVGDSKMGDTKIVDAVGKVAE